MITYCCIAPWGQLVAGCPTPLWQVATELLLTPGYCCSCSTGTVWVVKCDKAVQSMLMPTWTLR